MVSRRVEGPTPNGGAYGIAYFQDAQGEPVEETKAVRVELVEYTQEDEVILRTYATLNGPEEEA